MTKEPIFKGVATALVTPLTANGVDYAKFGEIIEWQIQEGINALVIAGTTGEGSTLSDAEHRDVLKFAIEKAAGRTKMIAGTGSNDTDYAISLSKFACELGYDGLLVVTPYYNKTTQKGLIAMFTAIADAVTKPVILYNVPSRTGVNIEPSTYAALADHPNIAAIKEANGNISKIVETAALAGDKLDIYSGNDDQIVPILAMGGKGVISVLSNVAPKQTMEICNRFFAGDCIGAAKIQTEYMDLINALFCEVNPIPVKAAVAAMGFGENYVRLPLIPMEKDHEEKLLAIMKKHGIL
ncbi:MAG: 4-hydroxy-tetrahydrodipicolinate synthase [Lachnospiraceae bacterium]|nr:4-hydroxy-tetrahydrodipicolinate synthase [Lachnospiraceae bacterium]